MGKRQYVIGLLCGGIADSYTVQTCSGAMKAAQSLNVNLVLVPGKYLDRDTSSQRGIEYEYQYNTLFAYAPSSSREYVSLIGEGASHRHGSVGASHRHGSVGAAEGRAAARRSMDALLILAGSIGCYMEERRRREFLEQFLDIPCILIGCKEEGFASINYDNYSGIREGMNYLIHTLNCRRIAMVGGPQDNTDAWERRCAYFETLRENGLPEDESMFVEGDLTRRAGQLLDGLLERHPDVEAICCVNDDTAIGVYESMNRRGLVPGRDIYVMGYDNTIQSAKARPAISTVIADASRLGQRAVSMAVDMLNGRYVESVIVPARFIRRQSFGNSLGSGKGERSRRLNRENFELSFEDIFYRIAVDESNHQLRLMFNTIMETLLDFYERDFQNYTKGTLLKLVDAFLHMGALECADMENLLRHIEDIYHLMFERFCGNPDKCAILAEVTSVYREIILAVGQQQGNMLEQEEQKDYHLKTFVTNTMLFEKGNDQSYAVLLGNLGWLDIENAAIYTFSRPIMHLRFEEFTLPKHMYLKAELKGGEIQKGSAKPQRRRTRELFHGDAPGTGSGRSVILPLFSNEMLYGLLVCDMTEKLHDNGEFLAGQLGAGVKMLTLLKNNEDIQNQYEQTLVTLRENNIALDTLAKSDGLTGILNRRGFMEEAEKRLKEERGGQRHTVAAYVDMNNLKIINDRYGHEEGDFSIRLISRLMKERFPNGVIGRIGGDEFALLDSYAGESDGSELVPYLYSAFNEFNRDSEKAYNVTVSMGVCVLDSDSNIGLEEALALADEKLYVEKQHRVKNVAKEREG